MVTQVKSLSNTGNNRIVLTCKGCCHQEPTQSKPVDQKVTSESQKVFPNWVQKLSDYSYGTLISSGLSYALLKVIYSCMDECSGLKYVIYCPKPGENPFPPKGTENLSTGCRVMQNMSLAAGTVALIALGLFGLATFFEYKKDPGAFMKRLTNTPDQSVQTPSKDPSPLTHKVVNVWSKTMNYSITSFSFLAVSGLFAKVVYYPFRDYTPHSLESTLETVGTLYTYAFWASASLLAISMIGGLGAYLGTRNEKLKKLMNEIK